MMNDVQIQNTAPPPPNLSAEDSTRKRWVITVELDELLDHNFEGFLDLIAERAGVPLLTDISYRAVAVQQDGSLSIEVEGDDTLHQNLLTGDALLEIVQPILRSHETRLSCQDQLRENRILDDGSPPPTTD